MREPEKNPQNLIPVIMEAACGMRERLTIYGDDYKTRDGTCIRDYVHVSDLAEAHVSAMDYLRNNEGAGLKVNLGSEKGISVAEMVEAAVRITGVDIPRSVGPRRPGDPAALTASCARAQEVLGWQTSRSDAENLLESTWKIYRGVGRR